MHPSVRFRTDTLRQCVRAVVYRVSAGGVQASEIPWGRGNHTAPPSTTSIPLSPSQCCCPTDRQPRGRSAWPTMLILALGQESATGGNSNCWASECGRYPVDCLAQQGNLLAGGLPRRHTYDPWPTRRLPAHRTQRSGEHPTRE